MRLFFISMLLLLLPAVTWLTNLEDAVQKAESSDKMILLNFSGSDWCGPCIRLKKEILQAEAFETYAADHLILVNADFPRLKKNKLSANQLQLNEAMAEKFNPEGKFPFTVLLDKNGKLIRSWEGLPSLKPEQFVQEISNAQAK